MATLEETLARIREGSLTRIPEDKRERMHRATEELRASGAIERALAEGDRAPSFELPDSGGALTSLASLLERGPLVLTFFRGHW